VKFEDAPYYKSAKVQLVMKVPTVELPHCPYCDAFLDTRNDADGDSECECGWWSSVYSSHSTFMRTKLTPRESEKKKAERQVRSQKAKEAWARRKAQQESNET
jgi:hypothetical protein